MKVAELKTALEERSLDTKGVKKDLAARLLEALSAASGDEEAADKKCTLEATPAAAEEAPRRRRAGAEAPYAPSATARGL